MKLPPVYGIIDGDCLRQRQLGIVDAAAALIEGGFRLLQLRWKGPFTRDVYREATRISQACQDAGVMFVINDRADIALLLNAGVHTGQDDLPAAAARQVAGPKSLVGVSTHNEAQFTEACAAPVNYIALGPIFGTVSKLRPDPIVGTAEVTRIRPLFPGPVVAIGGITRERAPEVWRAGADSVAVISDLYPDNCTKASVRARAEEWMRIAAREFPS